MDQILQKKHEVLARSIAADGMVLLENHHCTLPLKPGSRVALFGHGQHDFSCGGSGAAAVQQSCERSLVEVLSAEPARLQFNENILAFYRQPETTIPDADMIAAAAANCDIALVVISRNAGEGADRQDIPGDFRLSEAESVLLERLGNSPFKHVVAVVNSGGIIELGWFGKYTNFHALLLCWQPGSEGLSALAEILCGQRNPSGRLTDTIAGAYRYWPSSADFQQYCRTLEYSEDIYVGYRYFETIPNVQDQVLYPFGYGLSYTTFAITCRSCQCAENVMILQGSVRNTGQYPGREVVQCYVQSPGSNRPKLELKDFCKTAVIAPGQSVDFTLEVPIEELKRFDENGEVGGTPGSFVLEKGCYNFLAGNNIRNLTFAGCFEQQQNEVLAVVGNIFQTQNSKKLCADGKYLLSGSAVHEYSKASEAENITRVEKPVMLSEVAAGKYTIDEFIAQLSNRELTDLCCGQAPRLPRCTGGIGNLPQYGVCTLQTADGPAGIRCCYPATWFPCAVAAACSWDKDLQFAMGQAIAEEGRAWQLDILLAPGLNIHRDPLCGRNFEYFSEDPLVSGRTAAALVQGVQSVGMGATLKHFACNSRETARRLCNSIISERALREIYLKGFEIAVKTAQPWCIMSSYNLINGTHASSSYALLTQLLRNEWGFDGVVMTDWMSIEPLWKELSAGNDLKMPVATLSDKAAAVGGEVDMDRMPLVSRKVLATSARRILQLIMKSIPFNSPRPEASVVIPAAGGRVEAMQLCNVSHSGIGVRNIGETDEKSGILYNIKSNYWRCETALSYLLEFQHSGTYTLSCHLATASDALTVNVLVNNEPAGQIIVENTGENVFQTQGAVCINVQANQLYRIKLIFDDKLDKPAALAYLKLKKLS
ncbi:MAG: beta-glucosidase [Lentisphaerae bacterium]|nr:beta-glucosidase [Lentisphaerota bacterium]